MNETNDLISRAVAIAKVEKARKAARTLTGVDFVMMLKDQPAVDAVPVVHARWVDIPDHPQWDQKMCSACGDYFCCQNSYCPSCGAKMDGERRDEHD